MRCLINQGTATSVLIPHSFVELEKKRILIDSIVDFRSLIVLVSKIGRIVGSFE
jgi:hypothetical protein